MKYKARQRGYKVLGVFRPDEILPHTGPEALDKVFLQGDARQLVKMTSLRYQTFKKNLRCVCCGIEGTIFLLELPRNGGRPCQPHFNLYAEREGDLVQLTKDHIQPRSRGGKDYISYMQTMCCSCNELKRDYATKLKTLRRIQDGVQTVYTVTSVADRHTLPYFATSHKGLAEIAARWVRNKYGWTVGTSEVQVSTRKGHIIVEHSGATWRFIIRAVKRI